MSGTNVKTRPRQETASFLVRLWREPGDRPVVRGYLRNLGSGEEQYIRDPEQIGIHILRHMRFEMGEESTDSDLEDVSLKGSSSE